MQPPSWNTLKVNPFVSVLALKPGEKVSPVIVSVPVAMESVSLVRATIRPEPAPWTVIPFPEIVTPEVQVQVPVGIVTVSPVPAELMADCTSLELHVAAAMVLAFASRPKETVKRNAHNSHFNLVIGTVPYILPTPHYFGVSGSILGGYEDKIHCTGGQSWDSCHVTRSDCSGVLPITTSSGTFRCELVKVGGRVKGASASAYALARGRKYPE